MLLWQERIAEVARSWNDVDVDDLGETFEPVIHACVGLFDVGVDVSVDLGRAIAATLDLINLFGLHRRVAAQDEPLNLGGKNSLVELAVRGVDHTEKLSPQECRD